MKTLYLRIRLADTWEDGELAAKVDEMFTGVESVEELSIKRLVETAEAVIETEGGVQALTELAEAVKDLRG